MAEIAVAVASEVAKCLVAPVGRHCSYVIFCDRRVRELNAEIEKLVGTKHDVQRSIDEAQNNMKPIKAMVETWVKEVETVANKARDVLDYDRRAQKTCFYGWLPNPKARYRLGNEASKMIEEIKDLIVQGQFERVYNENPPPGLVGGASDVNLSAGDGGNTILKSQASTFQDVMKALYDEEHKVIGVYGPGGVGKTTLLEIVEEKLKKEREEKLKKEGGPLVEEKLNKEGKLNKDKEGKLNKEGGTFDMIVKSKVSQTPDLTKIQFDIAYALGLKDLKDEPSEEGRRDLLFKRLQRNPSEKVLIILDDLWAELDLKEIGIPLGNESMKCKLLLASRDKRVLEQRMHADQTFRLKSLEEDEAFKLFEKIVGDRLRDDEELKEKAAQVVTKLAGLPLLINSVASTLKCSDVSTWEDMLIKIEDPNNERIVKWSYDHLESEEAKCLFLLCGLIGGTIEVELLLGLGMGLGLFGGFDNKMQSLRNRLNTMLNSLHSFCLLQDGGDGKENVTIHDLYSEVVVSNVFSGQNSLMINNNYGSWPKKKLEKCWACLVNVRSDRLAKLMLHQFPHVKILMLSEQYNMGDCSRMDFTYMEELRVLYLGSMRITSLPSSMEILGNLRSLSINCHVEDVANLGKLKALQILSFAWCTISRLPKEIGELTNLRSLNLSNCKELQRIEPGVLKCLIKLEELHMKGSFDRWMGKNEKPSELCNARLAELRSMTELNSLEISIPDPIILLEVDDLPFENLTRFWINIGNAKGREFKGLRTMKIKSKGHDGILLKKWVHKTLQKTQYLLLDGLGEFKIAHKLSIQIFPKLKHLDIQDSPSVKYIANSSNSAFTVLESLFLNNLINLEKICHGHGHIATECLSKLNAVRVKECKRLKYLWCLSQMQNLVRLEEIEVRKCDSMRAIARKDIVPADYKVELPCLRRLDLARLPKMTSFCTRVEMTSKGAPIQAGTMDEGGGDEGIELVTTTSDLQDTYSDSFFDIKVSLPNLEDLEFDSVGSFKRIWHDELSGSSFHKLATITVENCSDLLHIFPSTIIERLHNLKNVKVKTCPSLKLLFDCGSLDSNTERIWHDELSGSSFYKLATITVENCSDLLHIFPSTITERLHNLEIVKVKTCPSLKLLFDYGSLDSNTEQAMVLLPKLVSINVESCSSLESLFNCGSLDSNVKHKIVLLPKLKKVRVSGAKRLRYMVMSHSQIVLGFPSLETVGIRNCSDLRYLFPNYTATTLVKLKRLEIIQCEQMKEVILEKEVGRLEVEVMSFPCLSELILKELNNLISFGSGSCSYYFSSLEDLRIEGCCNFGVFIPSSTSAKRQLGETVEENDESPQPFFNEMVTLPNIRSLNIEGVPCKELGNNHVPADSFSKLKSLILTNCDNLQRIATYYMWKNLQRCLEFLLVTSCRSIEIIYEGDRINTECSELRSLVLCDLRNLRHIWQSDPFPKLGYVEVMRCPCLKILFPTFTAKFLGQIKKVVVESCENMELIAGHEKGEERTGTTITFSQLKILRLFKLPKFSRLFSEKYSLKFAKNSEEFPSLQVLSIIGCGAEPDQVIGDWERYQRDLEMAEAFAML